MLGAVLWFDALILFFYTCFHYMTCTILWCYVPCDVVSVSEAMHTAVRQPADVPTNLWWGKLVDTHLLQHRRFTPLHRTKLPFVTAAIFWPPSAHVVSVHDVFSPKLTHCCVAAMLCIFRAVKANISCNMQQSYWHLKMPLTLRMSTCCWRHSCQVSHFNCRSFINFLLLFYLCWKNVITPSNFCSECVVCGCHFEEQLDVLFFK